MSFYGACRKGEKFCIVTEYCAKRDLEAVLFKQQLSLQQKIQILKNIAFGMKAAHKRKFIHRDLKLSNILV